MRTALVVAILVAAYAAQSRPGAVRPPDTERTAAPHEARIPVGNADLYSREIGQGQPIIVLHGGPDFDHSYFLPEMDRCITKHGCRASTIYGTGLNVFASPP